jgi:prepilin-type N-terminal cleavage/methylation domain-containing protein
MNSQDRVKQTGFSLIELLVVVLMLSIVVGALFSQIERAQTRYNVEGQKLDLTQQERDFIDQFTRDLHQAAYPSPTLYGNRYDLKSNLTATGVWSISQNDLSMEGDVDGDGVVDEISYHYDDGSTWPGPGPNPCPCLRRSSTAKVDGKWPWEQPAPVFYTQVQNIIPIAGQPFFLAYAADGSVINTATPLVLASASLTDPTYQKLLNIKSVRITFTTQGLTRDADVKKAIQVTMTGMARLPNN